MMDPWLVLALASGAVIAALGLFLLAADPRRDWNRVFALFAVFWGLQIVAANAVRVAPDGAVAGALATLSLALLVPLYFFLVVFAAIFPSPRRPFGTSWRGLLVLLVPAALALGVLLVRPRLLLSGVAPVAAGGWTMAWGPAFPALVLAPLYGGFFYALFVMTQRLGEARTPIERRQVVFVLIALALFVAYNVPLQALLFGAAAIGGVARQEAVGSTAALIGGVMVVGLAVLVLLAVRVVRRLRLSRTRQEARDMRAVLFALAGCAVIGITEATVWLAVGVRWQFVGLVRAAAVGLIAYGVARYQLFDLDLRVRSGARVVTTLVLLASAGVTVWTVLGASGIDVVGRVVGVMVVVPLIGWPVVFATMRRTRSGSGSGDREGEQLYLRKLQVYQAALETARSEGQLARMRADLGLDDEDHAVAARLVAQGRSGTEVVPGMLAFDRYLVDALIGEGAFGRAFLARDVHSGRRVVIKELAAHWRGQAAVSGRFLREARVMGRLRHPRIVSLLDVERRGADQFLVLEHVEGGTLSERLAGGRLPVDEVVAVAGDLLDGLEAAHRRGVVHRDLKPANVLLDLDGRAKIADFGVAALLDASTERTLAGLPEPDAEPVGSLLYMAPEQAAGAAADARADLFAVGAIAFHAVMGAPSRRLPRGVVAARAHVADEDATNVLEAPAELVPFLSAALAPDPADRPRSAKELGALLPRHRRGAAPWVRTGARTATDVL